MSEHKAADKSLDVEIITEEEFNLKRKAFRLSMMVMVFCMILATTTGMTVFAASLWDYELGLTSFNVNNDGSFEFNFDYSALVPDGTRAMFTARYYTMEPYELVQEYRSEAVASGGVLPYAQFPIIDTTDWVTGEYKLAIHVDRDAGYAEPLAVGYFNYTAPAPVVVPMATHSLNGFWSRAGDGVGVEISGSTGVFYSFGEDNEWTEASDAGIISLGDVKFSQIQLTGDNQWSARDLWVFRNVAGVAERTAPSQDGLITMSEDGQSIDVWSMHDGREFTFTYFREAAPAPVPAPVVQLAANERAIELAPGVPGTVSFPEAGVAIELVLPGGGEGTVQLDKMTETDKALPEGLEALDVFLKIERSEGLEGVQATIKVDMPEVGEEVDADTLALYRFNETTGVWDLLPSEIVNGQVWATVVDFSLFGLFAQPVAAVAPAPAPTPVPLPTIDPAPAPEPAPAPAPAPAPVALPQTDGGSALPLGMMAAFSLMAAGGYLTISRKK